MDNFKCILCGSGVFTFVNKLRDSDKHNAVKCGGKDCEHVQLYPIPTLEEENEFYQSNRMQRWQFPEKSDAELMTRNRPYGIAQAKHALEFITSDMSVIEIGSGYGWFIKEMKNAGIYVDGVELSDEKRKMAQDLTGAVFYNLNLLSNQLPNDLLGKYDAVCMFHLLEHLTDPVRALENAMKLLKPGGKIILEVPNHDDWLKSECPEYNDFMYLRGHMSYFNVTTLKVAMIKAGICNISITGKQIYSVENAIWWLREKRFYPNGMQTDLHDSLEFVNSFYKSKTEDEFKSDSVFALGTRDGQKSRRTF